MYGDDGRETFGCLAAELVKSWSWGLFLFAELGSCGGVDDDKDAGARGAAGKVEPREAARGCDAELMRGPVDEMALSTAPTELGEYSLLLEPWHRVHQVVGL